MRTDHEKKSSGSRSSSKMIILVMMKLMNGYKNHEKGYREINWSDLSLFRTKAPAANDGRKRSKGSVGRSKCPFSTSRLHPFHIQRLTFQE